MKKINVNIRPNDGYWFQDADGTKFKAASWARVTKKVVEYRRLNNRPVGNVLAEVMAQACSRNPALCHETQPLPPRQGPALKTRVLQWLAAFERVAKAGRLDYVGKAVRDSRVNGCLGCPFHKRLPTSCAACQATIGAHSAAILTRAHAPDRRVSACEALGIYIPVASWLDEPTLVNASLPAHCWRRRG